MSHTLTFQIEHIKVTVPDVPGNGYADLGFDLLDFARIQLIAEGMLQTPKTYEWITQQFGQDEEIPSLLGISEKQHEEYRNGTEEIPTSVWVLITVMYLSNIQYYSLDELKDQQVVPKILACRYTTEYTYRYFPEPTNGIKET